MKGSSGFNGESDVDTVLQALGRPLRRRIVEALAEEGEMSYADLMRRVGVEDSGTFAFHLRGLRASSRGTRSAASTGSPSQGYGPTRRSAWSRRGAARAGDGRAPGPW